MKTLTILGIVLGIMLIAAAAILVNTKTAQAEDSASTKTTGCNAGNCAYASTGGCTAESNCGSPTCSGASGGSCGCGAK